MGRDRRGQSELVLGITVSDVVAVEDILKLIELEYGVTAKVKHEFDTREGGKDFRIQLLKYAGNIFEQAKLPRIDQRSLAAKLTAELSKRITKVPAKVKNSIIKHLDKAFKELLEAENEASQGDIKHTMADLDLQGIRDSIQKKLNYYRKL